MNKNLSTISIIFVVLALALALAAVLQRSHRLSS